MTTLDQWEQENIKILTSKMMGEWLHRRDIRRDAENLEDLRGKIKTKVKDVLKEHQRNSVQRILYDNDGTEHLVISAQAVNNAIAEINEEINKQSSIPCYTAGSIQISDIGIGLKRALEIIRKHTGLWEKKMTRFEEYCPLKSIEELIERIEQAKQYKGKSGNPYIDAHDVGLDRYFDLGLDKAIKIIKEYCEVEE